MSLLPFNAIQGYCLATEDISPPVQLQLREEKTQSLEEVLATVAARIHKEILAAAQAYDDARAVAERTNEELLAAAEQVYNDAQAVAERTYEEVLAAAIQVRNEIPIQAHKELAAAAMPRVHKISRQLTTIKNFDDIDEVTRFLNLRAQFKEHITNYGLADVEAEILDPFLLPLTLYWKSPFRLRWKILKF